MSPDRTAFAVGLVFVVSIALCGCGRTAAPPEPEAKVRLTKVLRVYQLYAEKNKKGPPDEAALLEFGQSLSPQERDEHLIGDDLDTIFTSPRDKQKYVIQFGLQLDPGGPTRAVAWEAAGLGGKRYVALSKGYVEEYNDETFQRYRK